jgi:hypothetical protein
MCSRPPKMSNRRHSMRRQRGCRVLFCDSRAIRQCPVNGGANGGDGSGIFVRPKSALHRVREQRPVSQRQSASSKRRPGSGTDRHWGIAPPHSLPRNQAPNVRCRFRIVSGPSVPGRARPVEFERTCHDSGITIMRLESGGRRHVTGATIMW